MQHSLHYVTMFTGCKEKKIGEKAHNQRGILLLLPHRVTIQNNSSKSVASKSKMNAERSLFHSSRQYLLNYFSCKDLAEIHLGTVNLSWSNEGESSAHLKQMTKSIAQGPSLPLLNSYAEKPSLSTKYDKTHAIIGFINMPKYNLLRCISGKDNHLQLLRGI